MHDLNKNQTQLPVQWRHAPKSEYLRGQTPEHASRASFRSRTALTIQLFSQFYRTGTGAWMIHNMMGLASINGKDEVRETLHLSPHQLHTISYGRTRYQVKREIQSRVADIFPWLRKKAQRLIADVPELCATLSSKSMPKVILKLLHL